MKDVILLVADKMMAHTLRAGLERHRSLGKRPITFEILVHPQRDGGVRTDGPLMLSLSPQRRDFSCALLMLDHEGSGTDESPSELESTLDKQLSLSWGEKSKSIVIAPELDIWMWGADAMLAEVLKWSRPEPVRQWLIARNFTLRDDGKPDRPKEAIEAVFRECRWPLSAANYEKIAKRSGMSGCHDPAFLRLKNQLTIWFPAER